MSDDELERLLAAAPRIDEPVIRLLERLQTGWNPKPEEIDPSVSQREFATWDIVQSPRTPSIRLCGLLEHGNLDSWMMTHEVLWIDADLRWALCEDGFWWMS